MKKPFKRVTTQPLRRQRLSHEQVAPSASFSYHSRRSDEALNTGRLNPRDIVSGRSKDRQRRFWLHRFGLLTLLLALVVCAGNVLSLSTAAKIVPLTTDNALLRDQAEYQAAASNVLQKSLANRMKLTINTKSVSQQLALQFPELASVNIAIPLIAHRPIIYVEAARPAIVLSSSSGSYIIATSGRVLAPSSEVSSSLRDNLPSVSDQSGIHLTPSATALTPDNVHFIAVVNAQLTAKNYHTKTMTLPPAAGELDVQIAGQPYFIKFNLQANNPREQAGTFLATIAQLARQHQTPGKYVDVRVEGRAYYL